MTLKVGAVLTVLCCLSGLALAQGTPSLKPEQPIEREIAGGESHTYQVTLTPGQFVRVVVEQKGIDVAVALISPGGKQLFETNLPGRAFGLMSLSNEAAVGGDYRIVVRTLTANAPRGAYQARLEMKAAATAQDKQRIAAERLLAEAFKSNQQGAATVEPTIEKAQQSLTLWREIADRYWEATALNLIGNAYLSGRKYDQAIDYYNQALWSRREAKDRVGEAGTLNNLGNAHVSLSRYEKAIEFRELALQIYREMKDRAGEAIALNGLGHAYNSLSRGERTIEYYEQALAIFREVKNRRGEANTLNNLGNAHASLSRYEKGIEFREQALQIYREVKDRASEGRTLNQLGVGYNSISRYEKAIEYYESALAISREVKDRAGERGALYSLGVTYRSLGRLEKALEYIEQARTINREFNSGGDGGYALNELGVIYRLMGQNERALEYHEQALRNNRTAKSRSGEVISLTYLGHTYYSLGSYEKALEYYQQALPISREVKNREGEGLVLNGIGVSYRRLNRPREAIGYYVQAVQITRETKSAVHEAGFLNNLMLVFKSVKEPRQAIFFGKQSVNGYQEIRGNIRSLDHDSQQSFVKDKEQTYRELADLLISQGRLPEAEHVIRMLKDEEYFEFIRRDSLDWPKADKAQLTPEEAALQKRYREIFDQLAALGAERGALIDKSSRTPEEEQRMAKLEADLVVAGSAFQKFLDQLGTELNSSTEVSGKVFQLRESQGLMEDLRELAKGVVALYTLVGEEKYRVILTTPDFQKGYEYPIKAADLNRKVLEFRAALQNPRLDPLPFAQELYKILLGPVASHFQFQPGNETNSALLLGDGTFLSLAQIKTLPNVFGGVELLTLSACNTATGGSGANGKEVEGFGVLAQRQGAKAVVASLWPVFDTSTSQLMRDFYRLREAHAGTSKAEALRQAQLKLLREDVTLEVVTTKAAPPLTAKLPTAARQVVHEEKSDAESKPRFKLDPKKPYAHPYYWAPFILIGNWK